MIQATITGDQQNDFRNNGFLTLDKFINLELLDELKKRIDLLFKGEFETGIDLAKKILEDAGYTVKNGRLHYPEGVSEKH